jgi:hypothetical protein
MDLSFSVSECLVPGTVLCPGAGTAERSQETLYLILNERKQIESTFIHFILGTLKNVHLMSEYTLFTGFLPFNDI